MKNRYLIFSLLAIISLFSLNGCNKWLTIRPENEIEKDVLFGSEEGFYQALNGVYFNLYQGYNVTRSFYIEDLESIVSLWDADKNSVPYYLSQGAYRAASVDDKMGRTCRYLFSEILSLNDILQNSDKQNIFTPEGKAIIMGEALGLRAFFHFDAIRIWGPVPSNVDNKKRYLPYVTEPTHDKHEYISYEAYMKKLMEDLDKAENYLGKYDPILKYSNDKLNTSEPGSLDLSRYELTWRQHHMNYYAVLALKAKVALWMGDKQAAYQYAKRVVEAKPEGGKDPQFVLGKTSDIDISNTETNKNLLPMEQIFGRMLDNNLNWMEYWPPMIDHNKNKQSAEKIKGIFNSDQDFRTKLIDADETWATSRKYRITNGGSFPLIRLSEMYLILMETAPIAEANKYYETYCSTGRTTYSPMSEESRESIILSEYIKEFFAEGNIFYTCKRMAIKRPLWAKKVYGDAEYVLPIPIREYDYM